MVTIYNIEFRKNKEDKEYIITELRGLSTDTKPTKIGDKDINNGAIFIEIDTGKVFLFDLDNKQWKEI